MHLLPFTTLAAVDINLDADWYPIVAVLYIEMDMTINVPGFHNFGDHCDPTP